MNLGPIYDFLLSSDRSAWVECEGLRLYLRRSLRGWEDDGYPCLDIAQAHASEPGNGAWTRLMDQLEAVPLNIHIECVTNPRLAAWLERRGYRQRPGTDGAPSFLSLARWRGPA